MERRFAPHVQMEESKKKLVKLGGKWNRLFQDLEEYKIFDWAIL